jgi:hypothetical protein
MIGRELFDLLLSLGIKLLIYDSFWLVHGRGHGAQCNPSTAMCRTFESRFQSPASRAGLPSLVPQKLLKKDLAA